MDEGRPGGVGAAAALDAERKIGESNETRHTGDNNNPFLSMPSAAVAVLGLECSMS